MLCRLVCSDYQKTAADISDNLSKNYNTSDAEQVESAGTLISALNLPNPLTAANTPASVDVALCSRSWRWEWFW